MKMLKFNIGLNRRKTNELMSNTEALKALSKFFKVLNVKQEQSTTEPTLIVTAAIDEAIKMPITDILNKVSVLSDDLDQDAIAVKFLESDAGFLAGDRWKAWGGFNSDYFLE